LTKQHLSPYVMHPFCIPIQVI